MCALRRQPTAGQSHCYCCCCCCCCKRYRGCPGLAWRLPCLQRSSETRLPTSLNSFVLPCAPPSPLPFLLYSTVHTVLYRRTVDAAPSEPSTAPQQRRADRPSQRSSHAMPDSRHANDPSQSSFSRHSAILCGGLSVREVAAQLFSFPTLLWRRIVVHLRGRARS